MLTIPTVLAPLTRIMWVQCLEPTPCYQYDLGPITSCPLRSLGHSRFPRRLTVTTAFGRSFGHVPWLSGLPRPSRGSRKHWGCGECPGTLPSSQSKIVPVCHQLFSPIFRALAWIEVRYGGSLLPKIYIVVYFEQLTLFRVFSRWVSEFFLLFH